MASHPIGISTKSSISKVISEISQQAVDESKSTNPFDASVPIEEKAGFVLGPDAKFDLISEKGIQGVNRLVRPNFERFAENYVADEPEILFIAEYVVEDEFVGALVVWEKYYDSTHYEVFKRNVFDTTQGFDRILFLDSTSLEEEKGHFVSYIRDTLGFTDLNPDSYYVMLDTIIKEDRIYEYRINAARVPKSAKEVDYDFILNSKRLLNPIPLSEGSSNTLFDFSAISLGAIDLAWVVALSNDEFEFFGRNAAENPLSNFVDGAFSVKVPRNVNDILSIVDDSISLFGIKETFEHLVDALGGLPDLYKDGFEVSVDATRGVFSFDQFVLHLEPQLPVLQLIFEISESRDVQAVGALSQLDIILPRDAGSESLSSITGLSRIFKFVNDFYLLVSYSQEADTFERLQEIKRDLEERRSAEGEEAASAAVGAIRDELSDQIDTPNFLENALFGVDVGQKENEKSEEKQTPTSTTDEDDTDADIFGNTTVSGVSVL